jgi:membrane-associated phospholipid phosphatase
MPSYFSGPWLAPATAIPGPEPLWEFISRFGEAQILLPAMFAMLLWLVWQGRGRPLAGAWLLGTVLAAILVTVSKVAFIGYEVGYAPFDYTGFSGHSMFAAAILPVLLREMFGGQARQRATLATAAGYALALLIAVSRLKTGAHSIADVVLGSGIGVLASAWALRFEPHPSTRPPIWLPAALAVLVALLSIGAPPPTTHGLVTALAVGISGRAEPYTRWQMRQDYVRLRASAQSAPA